MKKSSYLTSLLLAASVCRAGSDQLLAAAPAKAARPASTRAFRTVRSVRSASTVADVVTAANSFMATLSTSQLSTLVQTYSSTNAVKWSNLPCGSTCRIGLQLTNLTTAQVAAALAVVQAATGTATGDGYDEIQQIRAADDKLGATANGYNSGIYFIAFLGTPSTTGTWQLQFGGHHLATNLTYKNGYVAGPTPKFEGVEPLSFTAVNSNVFPTGTACAPLANEASTMMAMIAGLTTAQKTTAKLSQTFSDVALGPGQDGNFPATKVGLPCSQLTSAQQDLVTAAMAPWVNDSDDATANQLLSYYKTQLANTYIAYSGTGLFTSNADYARIDGPNVWIEFVCQNGVVYQNQIHYHSIWRDHARDYGGSFYTTVTATKEAAAAGVFSIYPNPTAAGTSLQLQLIAPAAGATYTLRSVLGQTLTKGTFTGSSVAVSTEGIAPGTYLLSVETPTQQAVTSRVQVY